MPGYRHGAVLVAASLLGCGGSHSGSGETSAPIAHDAGTGPAVAPGDPDAGEAVQDAGGGDVTDEPIGVLRCGGVRGPFQRRVSGGTSTPPGAATTPPEPTRSPCDPDYPSTIYAGSNGNGIFRSTDCGATWGLVSTGAHASDMSSGNAWSMAIDPVTPDTMYVVEGYGSSGLWKSTNGGVDWQNVLTDPAITTAFYRQRLHHGREHRPHGPYAPRHRTLPRLRVRSSLRGREL